MNTKYILLIVVALGIVGSIVYLESLKPERGTGEDSELSAVERFEATEEKTKQYLTAKEITTPDGFINTDGITVGELIGKKVILVDFWTYSCINCQRTTPFLNEWYRKYKNQGLEIIGIHTPEFEFEKDYDNVSKAVDQFKIQYPVVLDNDYSTWFAYENRYWPRKYLIDIDGFIVYDHIGEGAYEETEKKIQELLEERKAVLKESGDIVRDMASPEGVEVVDATKPRSPEIYFGSARNNRLGNGVQGKSGTFEFSKPSTSETSVLYFDGLWKIEPEYAQNQGKAKIIFRYQAEKVFFVARSANGARVTILQDGKPAGMTAGTHVESDGTVFIQEDRLYRLVENPDGWGEHTLEIIIEKGSLEAYTFTFG